VRWKSWSVFETTMLMHEAVYPEHLCAHGNFISRNASEYTPRWWFILYQADVWMRSKQFERRRRGCQLEYDELDVSKKASSHFDPAKPGDHVFMIASSATHPLAFILE
jgi:hypothetical protein